MEKVKKESKQEKRKRIKEEEKKEKLYYRIFIGFCILNVVHYWFFEEETIGYDYRYNLYIFWIPTLLGVFITLKLSFFKEYWKEFLLGLKEETRLRMKMFYCIVMLFAVFIFSYIFFGFTANAIWNHLNIKESEKHTVETLKLPVERFSRRGGKGTSNGIGFYFNGNYEKIKTSYDDVKLYLDQAPQDYYVILEVKKGLWNYYLVQNWDLVKK
ncbi:MAG TPA: hypothetical protein VJL37_04635 [Flavobacterium sp.]|nr:hypothetical protein [Flavobacterium sp.]